MNKAIEWIDDITFHIDVNGLTIEEVAYKFNCDVEDVFKTLVDEGYLIVED